MSFERTNIMTDVQIQKGNTPLIAPDRNNSI